MYILLSSEETLYNVQTKPFLARGRTEQVGAALFYKLKHSLPTKQQQEQSDYINTAAKAAYASLNKLDWTGAFHAEINLTTNTDTPLSFERDSSSVGLGYALALALEWRKQLNKPIDYDVEVFATGEIHSSGSVTAIGHLETKVTAACNFMEAKKQKGALQQAFVVFYPSANEDDITFELQTRVKSLGGQLFPVDRLQSALVTLLGDAYDGDAEGRWEPFKGLLSFNYEDSLRFFGRERALAKLSQELGEAEGLVVVTGVSGSGKSSLIKAGLIPQISHTARDEGKAFDWLVSLPKTHDSIEGILTELLQTLDVHWSSHLASHVAEAFTSTDIFITLVKQAQASQPTKRFFYYIDQYEDVFNHQDISREQAQQLAPVLAQLAKNIPNLDIMISIRSEYENMLGQYGSVSHVNPELNASEWRDIVYKQATSFGLRYEEGLEKRIVNEASRILHALPALEYLLEQLYKKAKASDKNKRLLTHEDYEQLKGIKGVIAARAEEVIAKHPMQAHAFFEYFVGLNNENKPYAKSVNIEAVQKENAALHALIQAFIDAQLVVDCSTNTEKQVKLAHDTLFNFDNEDSAWTALKEWFEESQEYLQWLNIISGGFKRWKALKSQQEGDNKGNLSFAFLLNEHDLKVGQAFQQSNNIQQPKVRAYIAQSQHYKEALLKQKNKKQRLVIMLVSVFLLIAVGAGFVAFQKEQEANSFASIAKSESEKSKKALIESNYNYAIALNEKSKQLFNEGKDDEAKIVNIKKNVSSIPGQKITADVNKQIFEKLNIRNVFTQSTMPHHDSWIEALAYSSDSNLIASGDISGRLIIWNVSTGHPLLLEGHKKKVLDLAFNKSGEYLVSISKDKYLKVWRVATGEIIESYYEADGVSNLSLVDGSAFYSTNRKALKVLHIYSGQVSDITKTNTSISSLKASDNAQLLAFGSFDGSLNLFNLRSKRLQTLYGHKGSVKSIDFSDDGLFAVTGASDNSINLWSIQTGMFRAFDNFTKGFVNPNIKPFPKKLPSWITNINFVREYPTEVNHVRFSPDGKSVVASYSDGVVKICDLQIGDCRILLGNERDFTRGSTTAGNIDFSSDGNTLLTSVSRGMLGEYNFTRDEFREFYEYTGPIDLLVVSPTEPKFVSASLVRGVVTLWELQSGKPKTLFNHNSRVESLCYSLDGKRIASFYSDGILKVWDSSMQHVFQFSLNEKSISYCGFEPNATSIRFVSRRGVSIINLQSGELKNVFDFKPGSMRGFYPKGLSPNGTVVATSSDRVDKVPYKNLDNGIEFELNTEDIEQSTLIVSSDNSILAAVSKNSYEVVTLNVLNDEKKMLTGHSAPITKLAFSNDGRFLLSGADNGEIYVWDLFLEKSEKLTGHNTAINSLTISPNGQSLISASTDGDLKFWDLSTRTPILDLLNKHNNNIERRPFYLNYNSQNIFPAPDGKTVALLNKKKGEILVLDMETAEIIEKQNVANPSSLKYSDDSLRIAFIAGDKVLYIWDFNEKKLIKSEVEPDLTSHTRIDFSPDGKSIVTFGSYNDIISIWDSKGALRHTLKVPSLRNGVFFSSDSSSVIVVTSQGEILAVSRETADSSQMAYSGPKIRRIHDVSFDRKKLLFSHYEGEAILNYEVEAILNYEGEAILNLGMKNTIQKYNLGIDNGLFSRDGELILSSTEKEAFLWNASSGRVVNTIVKAGVKVEGRFFSGSKVIFQGPKAVKFWDISDTYFENSDWEKYLLVLLEQTGKKIEGVNLVNKPHNNLYGKEVSPPMWSRSNSLH